MFEKFAPKNPYYHYESNILNLALPKACDVAVMQSMLDAIKCVGILFLHIIVNNKLYLKMY